MIRIINGDCLQELPKLAASGERFHACVTDPPYHLTSIVKRFGGKNAAPAKHGTDGAFARASKGFMGQTWDGGDVAANPETWRAVYDCLLPGAHLVAFGGTRTYHRMACAIEDAGFEIRDTLMWLYGSGFPKSHNVSVGIDKAAGAQREVVGEPTYTRGRATQSYSDTRRVSYDYPPGPITAPATPEAAQWAGWGTALKPAVEPIILARKPLIGTVVATVLKHGTGALNIDASRVDFSGQADEAESKAKNQHGDFGNGSRNNAIYGADNADRRNYEAPGRWPANLLHDGSDEVLEAFAEFGDRDSGGTHVKHRGASVHCMGEANATTHVGISDTGTAARFFKSCEFTEEELRFHFCGKADAKDRAGSRHPTVKPGSLMLWLVKLICPPGGTVLDPFAGSGSTLLAADQLGFSATGIEMDPTFAADARRKVAADAGMFAEIV